MKKSLKFNIVFIQYAANAQGSEHDLCKFICSFQTLLEFRSEEGGGGAWKTGRKSLKKTKISCFMLTHKRGNLRVSIFCSFTLNHS